MNNDQEPSLNDAGMAISSQLGSVDEQEAAGYAEPGEPQLDEPLIARILGASYEDALSADPTFRKRWFKLFQVGHRELLRVVTDVTELMDADNDVKLISLIGMTGIGKTTLASALHKILAQQYEPGARRSDCPVLYVHAPANGERSLSWKVLYRRILQAGQAPDIDQTRPVRLEGGYMHGARGGGASVAYLREQVETMLKARKVRALIIDEALHLLRFNDYSAIMDTLKSLADIEHTKLILIGTHQIADLMTQYAQVIRRSEIVHFKRYRVSPRPSSSPTADEEEYITQLLKLQQHWPSAVQPNLEAIWHPLMRASLGSIGITKTILQQLLVLQLAHPGEQLEEAQLRKALKASGNLARIEAETVEGEAKLEGVCYGDGEFLPDWMPLIQGQRGAGVAACRAGSGVRHA